MGACHTHPRRRVYLSPDIGLLGSHFLMYGSLSIVQEGKSRPASASLLCTDIHSRTTYRAPMMLYSKLIPYL